MFFGRRAMVAVTAIFVLILAAGYGLREIRSTEIIEMADVPVRPGVRIEPNPYLITSMQRRNYDSEPVSERRVRETAGFVSWVISFLSDGDKQYALLNRPKSQMPEGGWPVVVVNHGYIDPKVYSTENSYVNTSAYFANAGFLVIKPDYRGHDGSEGEAGGLVSRIGYAVDVLNLLAGVRKMPEVNPQRIYMYGHSMGGDVTLRVMEVCRGCVRAATLWAPAVTDWPESFLYFSRRNTDDPARRERAARFEKELAELFVPNEYGEVSTIDNVDLVTGPVNIHHGTADESVPYEWGVSLAERFKRENKEYIFYSYDGDNHDMAANWSKALKRDIELFSSDQPGPL